MVTEPKVNKVKTDKRDAKRLALILENHDFKDPCHVPDKERREDRQVSRTLIAIQKDIIRTRNRIRKLLDFHGIEVPFADKNEWRRKEFEGLRELPLSEPVKVSSERASDHTGAAVGPADHLEELPPGSLQEGALQQGLRDRQEPPRHRVVHRHPPHSGAGGGPLPFHEREEDRRLRGIDVAASIRRERLNGKAASPAWDRGLYRSTLIENSWTAIRKDPALLSKFSRVWRSSGSKKKAIVAVARTLIVRLRACMLAGTPYKIGVVK